jgi:hypothetical protein
MPTIKKNKYWLATIVGILIIGFFISILFIRYYPDVVSFFSQAAGGDKEYAGTVTSVAGTVLKNCANGTRKSEQNKETCYSVEFSKVALANGPEYAFKVLYALQGEDRSAYGCHFIAHGIGYGTYKRNPADWQKDITTIDPGCSYGAPMGIIELYAASLPGGVFTKEFIPTICGEHPRADCNHIVGHLLLADESMKGNVERALPICQVFTDKTQRKFCQTGVFMEHITAQNLIAHGYADSSFLNWPARLPEIEKLCREHTGEEAVACWEESSHAVVQKFPNDPGKVFDFCNSAPLTEAAYWCKRHSIGIIAGTKNFDISSLAFMCELPQPVNDPTFKKDCYDGLAGSAISTTPQDAGYVIAFCDMISKEYRAGCFGRIGNSLLAMGRKMEDITPLCQSSKEFALCTENIVGLKEGNASPIPRSD